VEPRACVAPAGVKTSLAKEAPAAGRRSVFGAARAPLNSGVQPASENGRTCTALVGSASIRNRDQARRGELTMNALILLWISCVLPFVTSGQQPAAAQATGGTIEKGDFRFSYDERGISGLAHPHDPSAQP